MSGNVIINAIFNDFQQKLDREQEIRENIRQSTREIEQISREMLTALQMIHNDCQGVMTACQKVRDLFPSLKEKYSKLRTAVPEADFYKYHDMWRFVTQRICFLISLTIWLEVGTLVQRETIAEILDISAVEQKVGFHLDIEDYLMGLLQLASELARYAVNSVTQGEYQKPLQISKFVTDLSAGFRMLNLKNDSLRKRFDGLKYDLKKIEEVVYDLSLRGLVPKHEPTALNAPTA